ERPSQANRLRRQRLRRIARNNRLDRGLPVCWQPFFWAESSQNPRSKIAHSILRHQISQEPAMKDMKGSRLACAIGVLSLTALLVPLATTSAAQSTTDGAIGGLISDQSGASVPGATVTARNVANNAQAEAVSDGSGRFLVIRLQPGVYAVEASLSGFAPFKRANVI